MNTEIIVAFLGAILGTGGITTVITTIFSRRKYKEESNKMKQDREVELDQYVNEKLKSVTELYISETKQLKESNDKLQCQINDLQNKIQSLMSWIVNDNNNTMNILIAKIREHEPDFDIPETKPFPNPYESDNK